MKRSVAAPPPQCTPYLAEALAGLMATVPFLQNRRCGREHIVHLERFLDQPILDPGHVHPGASARCSRKRDAIMDSRRRRRCSSQPEDVSVAPRHALSRRGTATIRASENGRLWGDAVSLAALSSILASIRASDAQVECAHGGRSRKSLHVCHVTFLSGRVGFSLPAAHHPPHRVSDSRRPKIGRGERTPPARCRMLPGMRPRSRPQGTTRAPIASCPQHRLNRHTHRSCVPPSPAHHCYSDTRATTIGARLPRRSGHLVARCGLGGRR